MGGVGVFAFRNISHSFDKIKGGGRTAGFEKPATPVLLVSQNQRKRRVCKRFLENVLLVSQNQCKRRVCKRFLKTLPKNETQVFFAPI